MKHGRALALLLLASDLGCAAYTGSGAQFTLEQAHLEPGWTLIDDLPLERQQHDWDCGLAAWTMVVRYWKVAPEPEALARMLAPIAKAARPIKAAELRDLAIEHGLLAFVIAGRASDLHEQLGKGRPLIVGLRKPTLGGTNAHYEVVVGLNRLRRKVITFDPALGYRINGWDGFEKEWVASGSVTLLLLPRPGAFPLTRSARG